MIEKTATAEFDVGSSSVAMEGYYQEGPPWRSFEAPATAHNPKEVLP